MGFLTGGSLFLFNKRVLRFFRRDGHNWRKKKDGRSVGEAHERLKVCCGCLCVSWHSISLTRSLLVVLFVCSLPLAYLFHHFVDCFSFG